MAKAQVQKKSARERYAELKREAADKILLAPVEAEETLYDFTTPSGMQWKLRRADIQLFAQSGMLPASLASKLYQSAASNRDPLAIAQGLNPQEIAQAIEFSANIVRFIAVSPRIVETPSDDPDADEIGYDDITQADFEALTQWAMGGGGEAERLGTFPGKRQQRPMAGAAGTGHGNGAKQAA